MDSPSMILNNLNYIPKYANNQLLTISPLHLRQNSDQNEYMDDQKWLPKENDRPKWPAKMTSENELVQNDQWSMNMTNDYDQWPVTMTNNMTDDFESLMTVLGHSLSPKLLEEHWAKGNF